MADLKEIFHSLSLKKYPFLLIEYVPALLLTFYLGFSMVHLMEASQNLESLGEELADAQGYEEVLAIQSQMSQQTARILSETPKLVLLLVAALFLTFGLDPLLRAFMFRIAGRKQDVKKDFSYAARRYRDMFGASILMFIIYAVPLVIVMLISFSLKPSLLIHDAMSAVMLGAVNVFLYMTNPLVALKGEKPVSAIRKSISSFLARKKDILTVFLAITILGITVTYLVQRFAFGLEPEIGTLVKSDFSVMLSYMSASLTVVIVQGFISSFFDYMHISARVKLLGEIKHSATDKKVPG